MLTAGTGSSEIIDAYVFHVQVDFHIFRFGQNGYRRRRCMNTAARLRNRHTLYAMYTRFVFELAVYTVTLNGKDNFLITAQFGSVGTYNTCLPALLLFNVLRIHAEEIAGKNSCFVTAGTATNFHNNILIVIRILRQHENMQFFFQGFLFLHQFGQFFFSHGRQLRIGSVGNDFLVIRNSSGYILILAKRFDNRCQGGMLFRQFLPFILSGNDGRVTNALLQVDKLVLYGLYLINKHAILLAFRIYCLFSVCSCGFAASKALIATSI